MPKFSVKKPLTVFVAVLAVLVLGVVAYLKMTPDLMPNMNFPYVIIVTTDPGASPEAVEADVTKPVEQSMATLDQIKSVTSSSRNSVSMVVLEFEESVNMDTISVDIQQKISALQGSWDDTIGAPYVLKINPSMLPVEVAAVSYEGKDITELSDFVDDTLSAKLDGITGVASVDISGNVERQLHVILDQKKLDKLSNTLADAIGEQLDAAAGQLNSARAQIENAKNTMTTAGKDAISSATEQALVTLQNGLASLRDQRTKLESNLQELNSVQSEKLKLDAENAAYKLQIEALRNDPTKTEEERNEAVAAIENNSDYIKLQADLAALDVRIAALGTTWDNAEVTAKNWQANLDDINKQIKEFESSDAGKIAQQVGEGAMTVTDGAMQLISANVQMDMALSQIDQGFATLEQSRTTALNAADLGSTLNINTITALLTAQNFSMPAGYLKEDGVNYMVSVGDEITKEKDLKNMVLFDMGIDGVKPIRLKDVAEVFITDNSDEVYAKLNGSDGLIATFTKQSTYATADVSDNISARFDQLEKEYPGLSFSSLMDQGEYIYLIINSILSSLGWGALFSVLILYLFLRDIRPTIITLCAIPISVIFAVVLMYFSGVTINMISLSGLAVAVGMLVDNSVVVIENIYRLRAKGATVNQAAVSGAKQVLGAITASTLTTVCVFAPIVFVEGITRQLFTDLALTMTYSLLASLIVALTLVPAMASGMLRKEKPHKASILDKVYPAYRKAIGWSLQHKLVVLGAALLLLVGSAWAAMGRGFAFMPEIDMNNINLTVTMPEDTDRETAVKLADEVIKRASTVENVETVGAMMSSGSGTSMMSSDGGEFDVTAYITLPEGESGMEAGKQIVKLCEDMDCEVSADGMMSMMTYLTGDGISLKVYGNDMEKLQQTAKDLAAKLEKIPGTADVSDGLEDAAAALHISVDRNAAMRKGVTVAQIYMQIAAALNDSSTMSDMTLDQLDVDVVVESPEESRMTRDKLMDLEITNSSSMSAMAGSMGGGMSDMSGMSSMGGDTSAAAEPVSFKLSEVATIEDTVSLNTIARSEQRRYVTVTAAIDEGYNVTKVTSEAERAVDGMELPEGITVEFDGENEAIMDAMQQLMLMMLLGIILVYFIMVAQFQSLKSPFIVMFTIPLAFTGGFIALLISGIEVSVISLIGFVMLIGIIVNNGIVLVDYINQQRLAGMERREAIIDAGVTRLRPILMTSVTTVLGLVVMAFAKNAGTALMQPVALVCIGGLLYATLMTLFVVPCMYDILNKKELRKVEESDLQTLDM